MKNLSVYIVATVLAVVASFVSSLVFAPEVGRVMEKESTYDRVMRTGKIRCGYAYWPTYLDRDPNTNKLSGIWYDVTEEIGRRAKLEVEWSYETSFGQYPQDLKDGKFDLFCGGSWVNTARSRLVDWTMPVSYQAVEAFVKEGDTRFDYNLAAINDSSVRVSTIDGEMASQIREVDFPKSTEVSLTQLSDGAQMLLNVTTGKADVTFTSPETVIKFLQSNPGTLQQVKTHKPLRFFPETYAVAKGEGAWQETLNGMLIELHGSGFIERTLKKHEIHPGSFYRVATPYQGTIQ